MTVSSRRRLIQALATGGGVAALPTEWKSPIIDSVMLPAHAQTTTTGCFGTYAGFLDFVATGEGACWTMGNDCLTVVVQENGVVNLELVQRTSDGVQREHYIGDTVLVGNTISTDLVQAPDSCLGWPSVRIEATITPDCEMVGTAGGVECIPTSFTLPLGGTACPPFVPECP